MQEAKLPAHVAGVLCPPEPSPDNMQFPTILLATVVLASTFSIAATQQAGQSDDASEDTHTLLRAKDWAAAFGWNLTTDMCQWPAVECDDSNTSVSAL